MPYLRKKYRNGQSRQPSGMANPRQSQSRTRKWAAIMDRFKYPPKPKRDTTVHNYDRTPEHIRLERLMAADRAKALGSYIITKEVLKDGTVREHRVYANALPSQ